MHSRRSGRTSSFVVNPEIEKQTKANQAAHRAPNSPTLIPPPSFSLPMENWHLSNESFWEGGSSLQSLHVQWSPQKPHFAPLHNQPMNPPPPNLSPPQFPHKNSLPNAYNVHENSLYKEEGGFGNYAHGEQGGWENPSYQGHGGTLQWGHHNYQPWNHGGFHRGYNGHQNWNNQGNQGFKNQAGTSRNYNQNQCIAPGEVQAQDGLSDQVSNLMSQVSELIEAVKGLTKKQEVTDKAMHALSKQVGQIAESMDVSKQEKLPCDTKLIPQHQPSSSGPQEKAHEEEAHVKNVHILRSDKTYDMTLGNRKLMLNVFSNISKSVVEHNCFRVDVIEDTSDLVTKEHVKSVSTVGEMKPPWTHKVESLSDYIDSIWKPPLKEPLKVELEELIDEAYECSSAYKTKMKAAHDAKIKAKRFKVRQRAWSYNSKVKFFLGKLKSKWLGRFVITIIGKFGEFEIEDPASRMKQVVNGHRLKPYVTVIEEYAKSVDVEEFQAAPPTYPVV